MRISRLAITALSLQRGAKEPEDDVQPESQTPKAADTSEKKVYSA